MINAPTIAVYGFYSVLFFLSFLCISRRCELQNIGVASLILLSPFQVTIFIKIGFGFSYFELSLLLLSIVFLSRKLLSGNLTVTINPWHKFIVVFIALIVLSALIALVRRESGELQMLDSAETPVIRSITATGRLLFYSVGLLLVRDGLHQFSSDRYWKYFALAGIVPTLALIYQQYIYSVPMYLYANNYLTEEGWIEYSGHRPTAFTQELTFYSYYTTFSLVAALRLLNAKLESGRAIPFLVGFYCYGIMLAGSRMGVLGMLIILLLHFRTYFSVNRFLLFSLLIVVIGLFGTSNTAGLQSYSNTFDRLFSLASLSPSSYDVDYSTAARVANMLAIFDLFLEKSWLVGVGYFNYLLYTNLPETDKNSYSFIIQLLAEFGPILFAFLPIYYYTRVRPKVSIHEELLFINIVIYSLSGIPIHSPVTYLVTLKPANKSTDGDK